MKLKLRILWCKFNIRRCEAEIKLLQWVESICHRAMNIGRGENSDGIR